MQDGGEKDRGSDAHLHRGARGSRAQRRLTHYLLDIQFVVMSLFVYGCEKATEVFIEQDGA